MSEEEKKIIEGLINRDNYITGQFLKKYRPLFVNTISLIFDYQVDKDECINELYYFLLKNDAEKLRQFQGRSTLGCWLKKVVIRFFLDLKKSKRIIDNISKEPSYETEGNGGEGEMIDTLSAIEAKEDLERLFELMGNDRYVMVIRSLVLEDRDPKQIAKFMKITTANLYNIKKRALAALARVAINDKKKYGNK